MTDHQIKCLDYQTARGGKEDPKVLGTFAARRAGAIPVERTYQYQHSRF